MTISDAPRAARVLWYALESFDIPCVPLGIHESDHDHARANKGVCVKHDEAIRENCKGYSHLQEARLDAIDECDSLFEYEKGDPLDLVERWQMYFASFYRQSISWSLKKHHGTHLIPWLLGEQTPEKRKPPTWDGLFGVSGVYVLKDPASGCYKIGCSRDMGKRVQAIASSMPVKPTLFASFPGESPRDIERELHHKYSASRMNGEWFDLSTAQAEQLQEE
ncbi:MAG: GIY-YIG nuclease family protein [bacterium]|nr:GIY-YIG nuclease family protein [bacterium]